MFVVRILVLIVTTAMPATFAQDRTQARSMTISERGIVATSQTLASQAGAQVLARGGNAIDAAIAANAALGAVEPMMNGIGGDLFVIYREAKSGKLYGLNASGWSGRKLTREFLRKSGNYSMPQEGIHSVTVPGCVDGWEKLHKRFGKAKWAELFRPAIYYARQGFPVTEWIQAAWKDARYKLSNDKNAAPVFLREGRPPDVGEVFRNPQLGQALELIARDGAKAFYQGPITKAMLATSRRLGGVLEAEDFREFESEWVEPVSTTYRGWSVYELPPNGQGIAALSMLNLMEQFPLSSFGALSAEAFHRKIEAQKLAYADLNRYVGDPRFGRIPVDELISKPYAEKRAKLVDTEKASCAQEPGLALSSKGDTIYLSTVDAEGNVVSLIQSIYLSFGSGIVVDDYGFHLHNRGGLFTLDEGHINELKPRKRPFHTIIPGYMEKDGKHIGFGIMGGLNQAQAHAQFISYLVDHEMNIQAALEAPRFTKLNFSRCDVMVERRVPAETQAALRAMGHDLDVQASFSSWMGGGQAVMHDSRSRVNYGASSPRKDGAAIPEPDGYFAGRE
jgi:gamma-glutamyltranspeptidase/glutathione hydrolase